MQSDKRQRIIADLNKILNFTLKIDFIQLGLFYFFIIKLI